MEVDLGVVLLLQQEDIIIRCARSQNMPFISLFLKKSLATLQKTDRDEVQCRAQE